jgi:hypothetical protein
VLEESKLSELEVEQEGLKVKLSKEPFQRETFAPHHFVPQPQFHGIELKESNEWTKVKQNQPHKQKTCMK